MYSLTDLHFDIPENVAYILKTLNDLGFEAFAVGGCIRDVILGKEPQDWDITTSAKPEQVKNIFHKTFDTGIEHGTITVLLDHCGYEVTTYRIDGEYKDGRHPEEVIFTSNLTEDLKRRDFTINAMAYNPKVGVVDEFGGIDDLNQGVIRCVGNAKERFKEDALRILRAIRFSAQLDFVIEDSTFQGIKALKENLMHVSRERINVELTKTICSAHPEKLRLCYETGVSKIIMPWFDKMMEMEQHNPYHSFSVGEHSIRVMQNIEAKPFLRWAALLHDVAKPSCQTRDKNGIDHFYGHQQKGKEEAKKILSDLRFDNKTIRNVTRLVACHDMSPELTEKGIRQNIYQIGEDLYPYFLQLKRADAAGKSEFAKKEVFQDIDTMEKLYQQILEKHCCLSMKNLAVTGNDLMEAGFAQGPALGKILKKLLEMVVDQPTLNQKEVLLEIATDIRV